MRAFLFLAFMPVLQLLMGTGALGLLYGRRSSKLHITDRLIVGFLLEIGLAEAAHLAAVILQRPFSEAVLVFEAGMAATAAVSAGIWLWCNRGIRRSLGPQGGLRSQGNSGSRGSLRSLGNSGPQGGLRSRGRGSAPLWPGRSAGAGGESVTPLTAGLFLAFALLVIYQVVTVTSGEYVYRTGDMTVEAAESFLRTDTVYQVNPLTGNAYSDGIPMRIRILCLPTLYAMLSRIFGIPVAKLVWELVPLQVLLMTYLAFWTLAECFFPEDISREKHSRRNHSREGRSGDKPFSETSKKLLFMTIVAAVFCAGDHLYGMDGFGILYCGFRGVTIRGAVLLPYTFGLALRRRWRLAVLCILAEGCMVWTLYGMGACLAVTIGMAAVWAWRRKHMGKGLSA